MEPLKIGCKAWNGRQWLAGCLLLLATVCQSGCMAGGTDLIMSHGTPTVGVPTQIISNWIPDIQSPPDPVHNGTPLPGLAGRVYLFSEKGDLPILAEGKIIIELYDDGPGAHGVDNSRNPPLVICEYDKAMLKKMEKHDPVGWGYTLFVPWDTYKPGLVSQVRLKIWFKRPNGDPLYADAVTLKLTGRSRAPIEVTHRQTLGLPNVSNTSLPLGNQQQATQMSANSNAFMPVGNQQQAPQVSVNSKAFMPVGNQGTQVSGLGSPAQQPAQTGFSQQPGLYSQPVR